MRRGTWDSRSWSRDCGGSQGNSTLPRQSLHVVVWFNWDVVLEMALSRVRRPVSFHYGDRRHGEIAVLKPHGSINRNRYLKAGSKRDGPRRSNPWQPIEPESGLCRQVGAPLVDPDPREINPELHYLPFPGEDELPGDDEDLRRIWQQVEDAIRVCDVAAFIGYSLPEYDSASRQFFAARVGGRGIPAEVIDPSLAVRETFQQLFGGKCRPVAARFADSAYAKHPEEAGKDPQNGVVWGPGGSGGGG